MKTVTKSCIPNQRKKTLMIAYWYKIDEKGKKQKNILIICKDRPYLPIHTVG
jgi:hypothetical protein